MIFEKPFLFCTFCGSVTCGDINYDYMPEDVRNLGRTNK